MKSEDWIKSTNLILTKKAHIQVPCMLNFSHNVGDFTHHAPYTHDLLLRGKLKI